MKTLVGGIIGLLLVVAVAGFAPVSALGFLHVNQPTNEILGCVPDEMATVLLDTGQFATGGNAVILCVEGYTPVFKALPLP